jgi:Xaa-Pro aminopeptidase
MELTAAMDPITGLAPDAPGQIQKRSVYMKEDKRQRIHNLIEAGKKHDLDWVLCMLPENIFYFSGFRTMFYTRFIGVLIPVREERRPVLIAPFFDRRLVEDAIWSPHWLDETVVWGPGDQFKHKDPLGALAEYLGPDVRLGVDAIQYDFYEQLMENFPDLEAVNLKNEIHDIRMIKSEEEIELIKEAFALTEKVMALVPEMLQRPITEKGLAARINYAAMEAGAEDNFYPTLVSAGSKMLAFHSPPLSRPIKENEMIRVACGFQIDGYGSDVVRHFCIGTPPEEMQQLNEAYFEALDATFEMLRPGIRSTDLVLAVEKVYRQRGCLDRWGYSLGHGLALTIHEPPRLVRDDQTVLRENMVLAIEPILVCPPYGAIAHCDGVRITADGAQWLSRALRDLVVV